MQLRFISWAAAGAAVIGTAGPCSSPAGAQAKTGLPKFSIATGRIAYRMTGGTMKGTSLLAWADGGKKIRWEQNISGAALGASASTAKGGAAPTISQWTVSDGKYLYLHLPLQGKVVTRIKLTPDTLRQASAGMQIPGLNGDKGKAVGKGTVLGKPCEIRESGGYKLWLWKGLPLKIQMAGQGMDLSVVATKVEAPAKLSAATFKVPAGYKIVDQKVPSRGRQVPHPLGK